MFPSEQVLTKAIYDEMQEFHPNTLLYTIPMAWGCERALKRFKDLVDIVDSCGVDGAPSPLHLKIKAYHADVANGDRQKTLLKEPDVAELLMPRDWYLKNIDQEGKQPFGEVKALVVMLAHQYYDLTLKRKTEGGYDLLDALDLYESLYYIRRQTWGDFPWGCVCVGCASGRCVSTQLC